MGHTWLHATGPPIGVVVMFVVGVLTINLCVCTLCFILKHKPHVSKDLASLATSKYLLQVHHEFEEYKNSSCLAYIVHNYQLPSHA